MSDKPRIDPERNMMALEAIPDTEIVAPVHELVHDTFEVIRHEIRLLRKMQAGEHQLPQDEVLRLQRLMMALSKAHRAQLDALDSEDLSRLDRAELMRQLRKELGGTAALKAG